MRKYIVKYQRLKSGLLGSGLGKEAVEENNVIFPYKTSSTI